jgi:hypothetical protein
MRHFDEDGNFIELLPEEDIDEELESNTSQTTRIRYIIKKREE